MKKVLTLCIILQNNKVLLGMKKRGFGANLWNGFGGKLQESETIEEALKRESFEEAGIIISKTEKMGIIDFEFKGDPEILEVHIFKCTDFEDKPLETEEMKPEWFSIDKIPYDSMWPDDKFWLPLLLEDKKFKGKFVFDKDTNILDHNLEVIETI
jgi:8-oxo-dGTP diphosphatase / 2-hydroxy-dATP diphosphatase